MSQPAPPSSSPPDRPRRSSTPPGDRALAVRVVAAVLVAMPAAVVVYRWLNWEMDGLGGAVSRPAGAVATIVLAAAVGTLWRTLAPPE